MRSDRRRRVCSVLLSASFCWGKINGDHFIHESRNNDRRVVKNNCLLISTFPLFLVAPSGGWRRLSPVLHSHPVTFFLYPLEFSWKSCGTIREPSLAWAWICVTVWACPTHQNQVLLHLTCLESPWILFLEDRLVFANISSTPLLSVAHDLFSPRAITFFLSFFCCASKCPEWADRKWGRS